MQDAYEALLALMGSLGENLEKLTALAERKIEAVQQDDLTILNEVMNQEQALALAFRGLEQTRDKLLKELEMEAVPLSQSAERFPPAQRERAQEAVQTLRRQYQNYQARSAAARGALEGGIRDVESAIIAMGGAAALSQEGGPGYQPPASGAVPPASMKTDFRA